MRQIQGGITLNWKILMYQCFLFQIGQKQVMWKPQPSSSLLSRKSNTHVGASDTGCVNSYRNVKARHSTDTEFSSFTPPHLSTSPSPPGLSYPPAQRLSWSLLFSSWSYERASLVAQW